jgi:hypothetical protein
MRITLSAAGLVLLGICVGALAASMLAPSATTKSDASHGDSSMVLSMEKDLASCRELVKTLAHNNASQADQQPIATTRTATPNKSSHEPVEKIDVASLRRGHLDRQIDESPEDPAWQMEVSEAVTNVLSTWPEAQEYKTRCNQSFCRIEFTTGKKGNTEGIMDQLNNLSAVQGERMILIDDSKEPTSAIAYFGRNGAISLNQQQN